MVFSTASAGKALPEPSDPQQSDLGGLQVWDGPPYTGHLKALLNYPCPAVLISVLLRSPGLFMKVPE